MFCRAALSSVSLVYVPVCCYVKIRHVFISSYEIYHLHPDNYGCMHLLVSHTSVRQIVSTEYAVVII